MTQSRRTSSLILALALLFVSPFLMTSSAHADVTGLQPVQQGNVTYVSGGVGADEQDALKQMAKDYNLKLINSDKDGAYMTDINLVIAGKGGQELIHLDATGPMFYAKLPAGTYVIKASSGDKKLERKVTIGAHGQKNVHLVW